MKRIICIFVSASCSQFSNVAQTRLILFPGLPHFLFICFLLARPESIPLFSSYVCDWPHSWKLMHNVATSSPYSLWCQTGICSSTQSTLKMWQDSELHYVYIMLQPRRLQYSFKKHCLCKH